MMQEWKTENSKERFRFTCTTALVMKVPFVCKDCKCETKVTPIGVYCRRKFDTVRFGLFRCCKNCYELPKGMVIAFPPDEMTILLHTMAIKNALNDAFNFSIDSSSVFETIKQRFEVFVEKMKEHGDMLRVRDTRFPKTACFACGKADPSFQCSRCNGPKYCSKQCNLEGWKVHKNNCEPLNMIGNQKLDINKKMNPELFI